MDEIRATFAGHHWVAGPAELRLLFDGLLEISTSCHPEQSLLSLSENVKSLRDDSRERD